MPDLPRTFNNTARCSLAASTGRPQTVSFGIRDREENTFTELQDGLRNYFTQFGDIDQCTIMRDPTGRSRGFAFLTFKEVKSVHRVLEQDHQLDGKMVS